MVLRPNTNTILRLLIAASLCGCADTPQSVTFDPSDITPPPVLAQPIVTGVPEWVPVPTYDGSGQAVHPDVVYVPEGWNGWQYWMAFTPYPGGNSEFENPSLLVSHDGLRWSVPDGLDEPVIPHATDGAAYNSDPDLFLVPGTRELALVYREVRGGNNVLMRRISSDGVTWQDPVELITAPNHRLISPAIVEREGHAPLMWVVDAGNGCASTTTKVVLRRWKGNTTLDVADTTARRWSRPMTTDLAQPGRIIWHLDVTWSPELQEFWAVYPARPAETTTCTTGNDLFVAESRDGLHWHTFAEPVLTTGVTPWTTRTIYRSSVLYDDAHTRLRIWISAGSSEGGWSLGYIEVPLIESGTAGNSIMSLGRAGVFEQGWATGRQPPRFPGPRSASQHDSFP